MEQTTKKNECNEIAYKKRAKLNLIFALENCICAEFEH